MKSKGKTLLKVMTYNASIRFTNSLICLLRFKELDQETLDNIKEIYNISSTYKIDYLFILSNIIEISEDFFKKLEPSNLVNLRQTIDNYSSLDCPNWDCYRNSLVEAIKNLACLMISYGLLNDYNPSSITQEVGSI